MMARSVFAADTETKAQFNLPSFAHVESMLAASCVSTADQVATRLSSFQEQLRPDEYIISMPFCDHAARLKSLGLTTGIRELVGRLGMVA